MTRLRIILPAIMAATVIVVNSESSHADLSIDNNLYCSAGVDGQINNDTASDNHLSLSDVTLTITGAEPQYTSSDCYGAFDPGPSSPAVETAALNAIFGAASGPSHLAYLDGTGDTASATGLGGIVFQVSTTGGVDGAEGDWTITWSDSNGGVPENLPIYVDFVQQRQPP